VLGTIGRGLANRAEKAAQIGKTFMEGVGGGLYRQVEEQLQPFLAGFMNRSVQTLTEGLFEGEEAKQAAEEARRNVIETLLRTPLSRLMPEPAAEGLEFHLKLNEAIAAHVTGLAGYRESIHQLTRTQLERGQKKTLRTVLTDLKLSLEPPDAFLETLGGMQMQTLSRPESLAFLQEELKAVW